LEPKKSTSVLGVYLRSDFTNQKWGNLKTGAEENPMYICSTEFAGVGIIQLEALKWAIPQ
jgi:hypothetical protein